MTTNSKATFESKKIALVGKIQPLLGIENSPDFSNVIIANNLTVKEVITSDSTALSTDNLHRDAIVSVTDRYVTTGFDSTIPKLGQHYARRYASNELATLMVDSPLPANSGFIVSQTGSPLSLSFITTSVTRPQELVDEFLMYVTSGFTNHNLPHTTFTGELPLDYSVQQLAGDFAGKAGLLFFAKVEHTDVLDLLFNANPTVGVANALPYITIRKLDGDAYLGALLPIAPYLESSNMYQMIHVAWGITNDLQNTGEDAQSLACESMTYVNAMTSCLTNSLKWAKEMDKISSCENLIKELEQMIIISKSCSNSLTGIKDDISILMRHYLINFTVSDIPKMLGDITVDTQLTVGVVRGTSLPLTSEACVWYINFYGNWFKDDSVEFCGKRFTVIPSTMNALEIAREVYLFYANGSSSMLAVTPSADTSLDADRVVSGFAPAITERARIYLTQNGSPIDITEGKIIVTTKSGISNATAKYSLCISDISKASENFSAAKGMFDLAYSTNNNAYLEYKSKSIGFFYDAWEYYSKSAKVIIGYDKYGVAITSTPYNLVDTLKHYATLVASLIASDLEYCLKKLVFTNETASPDMMTMEARRSSTQLINEQKAKVSVDNRAIIDVNLEMGKRPMITFAYEGNLVDTLQKAEMPINLKKQVYSAGDVINASSVRNASLSEQCGSNPVLGCNCESNYNNICMVKASMPNFAGFVRSRTMTTCGNMWTYSSEPWDMTIEIIQRPADTSNEDVFNVEDSLGKTFDFVYTQNGSAGETIEIQVSGAVLKGYDDGDSQGLLTHVLQFTVTGFSRIILK